MIFSSLIMASMVLSLFSSEDDSESLLSDLVSLSSESEKGCWLSSWGLTIMTSFLFLLSLGHLVDLCPFLPHS